LAIRVCVIGVGYLGQHHARIYSEMKDAELVGIVDIDEERADAISKRYGCAAYYDHRDILSGVDALSIVTPTTSHYSIAMDCLGAGKDLFIEKPLTETVQEADELIAESERRTCIIQVGHIERYNPALRAASEMVKGPRFLEAERLSPFPGRGTDVDITLDLMIHDVDIMRGLIASPVREIRAVGARLLTDKIDFAKAWIEFENGCKAMLTSSRVSPEKERRLRVFQKDSYLSIDYQKCEIKCYYKTSGGMAVDTIKPETKEPLKAELEDFLLCVRQRKRPLVSAIEGRDALKIVLDITDLIRRGL